MTVFDPLNSAKIAPRQISMPRKLLNIHSVEYPKSEFPIRLPRSVFVFKFCLLSLLLEIFTKEHFCHSFRMHVILEPLFRVSVCTRLIDVTKDKIKGNDNINAL